MECFNRIKQKERLSEMNAHWKRILQCKTTIHNEAPDYQLPSKSQKLKDQEARQLSKDQKIFQKRIEKRVKETTEYNAKNLINSTKIIRHSDFSRKFQEKIRERDNVHFFRNVVNTKPVYSKEYFNQDKLKLYQEKRKEATQPLPKFYKEENQKNFQALGIYRKLKDNYFTLNNTVDVVQSNPYKTNEFSNSNNKELSSNNKRLKKLLSKQKDKYGSLANKTKPINQRAKSATSSSYSMYEQYQKEKQGTDVSNQLQSNKFIQKRRLLQSANPLKANLKINHSFNKPAVKPQTANANINWNNTTVTYEPKYLRSKAGQEKSVYGQYNQIRFGSDNKTKPKFRLKKDLNFKQNQRLISDSYQ